MTAEQLEYYVQNDYGTYLAVTVRTLRVAVDRAANALAASNAEWHDDPEGDPEGHAEHHAPAEVQFTRGTRDAVIASLAPIGSCVQSTTAGLRIGGNDQLAPSWADSGLSRFSVNPI